VSPEGHIIVDLETRSRCDLKTHGSWRYAEHPSTELLCGVALDTRVDPARVYVWSPFAGPLRRWRMEDAYLKQLNTPFDAITYAEPLCSAAYDSEYTNAHEMPDGLCDAISDGATLIAHNAWGFDELIWDALGYPRAAWLDSLPRARRRGLPGRLDLIGKALYGLGKDPIGAKVLKACMKPTKFGGFLDPDPPRLSAIVRYCLRDVMLLAALWEDERLGDAHPDDAVLLVHRAIDRRGVLCDVDSVLRLQSMAESATREAIEARRSHDAA